MRVVFAAAALIVFASPALQAQDAANAGMQPAIHKGAAHRKSASPKADAAMPLSPRERALQMLNRFTYGPRPGEVERVLAQGADQWLEQQLNPASIPDGTLDNRLKEYPSLASSAEQILAVFPDRGAVQQVAEGKRPYPADALLKSLYQVEVAKYQGEQQNKLKPAPELTDAEKAIAKKEAQANAARIAGQLFALPKKERMAAFNELPVDDRIAFANNVAGDQRSTLFADFTPRERETINAMQGGVNVAFRATDELAQAKILRSVLSERQLQEVMTDFWFNHFNIDSRKDSDQWYTSPYERDVIRAHALGRFRDLLLATAESPAMMVYLDNWLSVGPGSPANGVDPRNPNSRPGKKGLNENYGREVMELHTVGVNGGYTQEDVTHLAAILTGWGVDRPGQGGPFQYDPKKHEPGTKQWFGYTLDEQGNILAGPQPTPAVLQAIKAANVPDGMKQGVAALSLLAASPRTAHFISFLLAQRFVADEPPTALVDRMADAYLASDGDIKTVLRTLVLSPEFNSHRFFRNKVKTPTEFLASAFRMTATDPQNPGALVNALDRQFGQPPYKALPPTGYYITADHWMNTQSLLARLNFADQLTHNHFANQKFDSSRVLALALMNDQNPAAEPPGNVSPERATANKTGLPRAVAFSAEGNVSQARVANAPGSEVALRVLEASLIGGDISTATDRFIHTQLAQQPASNPTETLNLLTALLLGSPEFQLR